MKRRKHVPLVEQLAAALACLLPDEIRDDLRKQKAPARAVRSMFEMDHVVLHCHGGSDRWWNLDPKLKAEHREKSKRDIGIAAKGKRIDAKWSAFMRAVAAGRKPPKRRSRWPKRER